MDGDKYKDGDADEFEDKLKMMRKVKAVDGDGWSWSCWQLLGAQEKTC